MCRVFRGGGARRIASALLVGLMLSMGVAQAQTVPPARTFVPTMPIAALQDPSAPAPSAAEPRKSESVTNKWWFWAAIGGVVVTTVAVVLLAGGGQDPPRSTLGNMDAFRR